MHRLNFCSKLIGSAFITSIVVFVGVTIYAQTYCVPVSDIPSELKNRAASPTDNKIHVTYSFNDPNISDASKKAIQNAIAQWNAVSNNTKVVFELAAPGAIADVEFKPSTNTDETNGCAGYKPIAGRVYYSPEWEQRAADEAAGATVIAHELGHYLGLNEAGANPSTPTIMNNPQSGTCQTATVPTTTVLPSDGTRGGTCIENVRPTPSPSPTPTPTPEVGFACDVIRPEGRQYNNCSDGCDNDRDGETDFDDSYCISSPVLIDVSGNGFNLTDAFGGVNFDLDADGIAERLSWDCYRGG